MKKYFLFDYIGLGNKFTYIIDKNKHKISSHEYICGFHRELSSSFGYSCSFSNGENGLLYVSCFSTKSISGKEFRATYHSKIKIGFLFLASEEVDKSVLV